MKLQTSQQIFEKCSNVECHEKYLIWNRDAICEMTDGQTDMGKLMVAFRNLRTQLKAYSQE